jgi:preprotein translocase subunit YajC
MPSIATIFAQASNAAASAAAGTASAAGTGDAAAPNPVDAAAQGRPGWSIFLMYGLLLAMVYFAFFRPQIQAKKKQEATIKSAKTGDKIVTSSGIHGVITNVKDTTVIVRVADNVKLEIEKTHIDKITRAEDSEKAVTAKVS